ncbi:MAG: UDP-2,3-diacylglucosamine diphosphatase [Pseudomonadota bacterium]
MTTLFISDLHIDPVAPEIAQQLIDFLAGDAKRADALYVLGDLFEAWIGDDDPEPHYAMVQDAFAAFSSLGIPTFFMHGNRDFLVGAQFAQRTGMTLLADPVVHEIEGTRVLLSHGDRYCTDDIEYQAVRKTVRETAWQQQVLSLPIEARRQMAGQARSESASANAAKSIDIMDVNAQAIEAALVEHDVTCILHGHTHRPAIHDLTLPNGQPAQRLVLGDWYTQGSVGRWDKAGFRLESLPR